MPSGPCCFCGATDYPMSLGGPHICPSCDCGNFGPDAMKRQGKELNRLRTRVEALEADKTKLVEACQEALEQVALLAKSPDTNWLCKHLRATLSDVKGGGDDG